MDKRESKKYYKKIIITGLVQGIGFRPLIYNMANDLNLKGYVKNIGSAVEIMLYATHMEIDTLITQIKQSNLPLLKIESIEITEGEQKEYKDFTIKQSSIEKQDAFFLLPDLPLCEECLKEINQSNNRRYKHGLNSCTLCGPRFSILKKVPYDRINTTMNQFPMCETCKSEYSDNTNRRFHAQTVSCHDCGPQIIFKDKTTTFHDEYAMEKAIIYLKNGGIIAIKGIGGYHLVCSPYNNDTVKKLRQLKGRETKPFAIMFKNIEEIKNHCGVQNLSKKEEEALLSNERSIIIIDNPNNSFAYEVLGKSTTCGCFLPYTPIQHLLFENFDALIVTSANIHSSTILYKDSEMLNFLKTSKEEAFLGILYHHREIIRSVEDSVSKLIKADNKIQIIRRGRGYTPLPIPLQNKSKKTILALGGDLKSSFTILKSNKAYVSQYFGDLEDIGINDEYTNSITDYINLLDASIDLIATDLHPSYHSTSAAKKFALPIIPIQHHYAHIGSVMAEHSINEPIIGVAFDGTGYGEDGNIWGGEFLLCTPTTFTRKAHLQYTKMIGGDNSIKDTQKTATCFLQTAGLQPPTPTPQTNLVKAALINNINTFQTSSIGRLFDAISSILGISHKNSYEGESSILLEIEASKAQKNSHTLNQNDINLSFEITEDEKGILQLGYKPILETILKKLPHEDKPTLALEFHKAVINAILKICTILREKEQISKVALSGGVFQNTIILENTITTLRENNFEVYYNQQVPPNDQGISLGQAYIASNRQVFEKG